MLVLSRRKNEGIRIGDNIVITINRISGNAVSIGIEAPRSLEVRRGELFEQPRAIPPANPMIEPTDVPGHFRYTE